MALCLLAALGCATDASERSSPAPSNPPATASTTTQAAPPAPSTAEPPPPPDAELAAAPAAASSVTEPAVVPDPPPPATTTEAAPPATEAPPPPTTEAPPPPPPTTEAPPPPPTTEAPPPPPPPTTEPSADVVISVALVDGRIEGERRYEASLGDTVELRVTSDVAEEVHLHGYDVLFQLEPGAEVRVVFEANLPGVWEAELHPSHRELFQLQVS